MKIYTRTGDHGETGLFGGRRVPKDDARVEAYGDVDELAAFLGLAASLLSSQPEIVPDIEALQRDLFHLGAELATEPGHAPAAALIGDADIERLERKIDGAEAQLPALRNFILPGGTPGAAALHAARCVCRRAERRVVALARDGGMRPEVIRYLNRLSDWLFVLARLTNHRAGSSETIWEGRKE